MNESAQPDIADVVEAMVTIRDRRAARKKEYEAADKKDREMWEKGERWLLEQMQATKIDSVSVGGKFTVFSTTSLRAGVGDWGQLVEFIRKTGEVDLLEHRVSSKSVKEYMEGNSGQVPPGVSTHSKVTINIRKK